MNFAFCGGSNHTNGSTNLKQVAFHISGSNSMMEKIDEGELKPSISKMTASVRSTFFAVDVANITNPAIAHPTAR